jgi:glycosyltransferase involved in cell wall biosynthesis
VSPDAPVIDLSIVIPVKDEEPNLLRLHDELTRALQSTAISYEVLIVDDGSEDGSFGVLQGIHARDPRVRVIRFTRNYGQTAAFAAGFAAARGRHVATDLTVRGAGRGIFWYANSVVPIPWDGIDTFQFPLPQGDYRVAPAGQPAIPGLYVKSLSYGDADLARERMVLRSNRIDEFVITLAVCPADDDSPCN